MSRLTFTPGDHTYTLAPENGGEPRRVLSVTTILKMLNKPALVQWAANTAADYANDHWAALDAMPPSERRAAIAGSSRQRRDRAAASGTQIHTWAEALIAGKPVQVPAEYLSKVEAVAAFLERSKVEPLRVELQVWSDDDGMGGVAYAGTVDLIARHPEHGLMLIDWKTGKGVYGNMGLQLAGYASADHIVVGDKDMPNTRYDTLAVAHVTPGGVDLHTLDYDQRRVAVERWGVLTMLAGTTDPTFRMVAL